MFLKSSIQDNKWNGQNKILLKKKELKSILYVEESIVSRIRKNYNNATNVLIHEKIKGFIKKTKIANYMVNVAMI